MFSQRPVLFSSQFVDGEMDNASNALGAILDRLHSVSNLPRLSVPLMVRYYRYQTTLAPVPLPYDPPLPSYSTE